MRIGYLVPEFPSQTHAFFWREVASLRAQGLHVELYSTRRPADDACRHDFAADARAQTTYLYPPPWLARAATCAMRPLRTMRALAYVAGLSQTPWKKRARLLGLIPIAAEFAVRARDARLEHVHVHSCADAAHLAALARILGGPPYSLTLHGDMPVYGVDHASKMRGAAFVATVTRPLQQSVVEQIGLDVERVPVVWMGVDTQRFRPRQRAPDAKGRLHLATVARLNATKGHVHALEALRKLVDRGYDVTYTIAGDGPHRAAIEADVERLHLGDRARLVGNLAEAQVEELLHACDVFVLTSVGLGEAAPVSVMEAMSCGLPVVSSIIGGTRDMIRDGEDGLLVAQGAEDEIERALARLADDLELRARIRSAARERATKTFDQHATAARLLGRIRAAHADVRL